MKRLAVAIAAALILLSLPAAVFAAPEESSSQSSGSVSIQESSDPQDSQVSEDENSESETAEDNEESDSADETSEEQNSSENSDGSKEESKETSKESSNKKKEESSKQSDPVSAKIDIDKIKYSTYNIKNVDMFIDIPADMYVLTPGISADSPALKAAGMTKAEAEKSLSDSDTAIKAFSKDFSYDITVTMVKNSNSKQIGNISALDDKKTQKLMDSLLRNSYTKGCAKNKYNDVLFLTLNMEYDGEDGSKIYGIQQYTIINDANIMITIQSKNNPLSNDHRALFNKIMTSVFFDTKNTPVQEEESSDVSQIKIQELDRRYLLIAAFSIIAAAALAGMIIAATKRRETALIENPPLNDNNEYLKYYEEDDEGYYDEEEDGGEADGEESPEDNNLYSDSKVQSSAESGENITQKLNSTAELEIPKNPYTPVGKAEPVAQPAMSVTSEIAKFSIINAQAKALEEQSAKEKEDTVVFAESSPKPKTSIEQIGESVFKDKEEKPVSEYERKFGKNRNDAAPKSYDLPKRTDDSEKPAENNDGVSAFEKRFGLKKTAQAEPNEDESSEDDGDNLSNFEKRFGKVKPEDIKAAALNAGLAEVKPVGELNIAPMITAKNLKPENDPQQQMKKYTPPEKDKDLAYLDDGMHQSEVKLMVGKPHKPENRKNYDKTEKQPESENIIKTPDSLYSPETSAEEDIIIKDLSKVPDKDVEIEPAYENKKLDDYLDVDGDDDTDLGKVQISEEPETDEKADASGAEKADAKHKADNTAENSGNAANTDAERIAAEEKAAAEKAEREKVFMEHINAPAESEELTEHIEAPKNEEFLKAPEPKKPEPVKKPEPQPAPENIKQEPEPDEEDGKSSFFRKIRNKIFDAGETDSIYMVPSQTLETNKDSTKSFFDKLKDRLKTPDVNEDGESEEMEEFFSDVSGNEAAEAEQQNTAENEKTADIIGNDNSTKPEKSGEVRLAGKPSDKFEFDIIKDKNGDIRINSLVDPNGNPVPLEIKDGMAEYKAKEEEKAQAFSALIQEEKQAEIANSEKLEKPENAEMAVSSPEVSQENEPKNDNKKFRKNQKKNNKENIAAPSPAVSAVGVVSAVGAAAVTAAAAETAAAVNTAETAKAAADAAGMLLNTDTAVKPEASENKAEKPDIEKSEKAEPDEVEAEKTEPDVNGSKNDITANEKTAEEKSEPKADDAEKTKEKPVSISEEEKKPESKADEPSESSKKPPADVQQKEQPEKAEIKKAEPEKPKLVLERDSDIEFEYPDIYFAQPIEPKTSYFTVIPKLESVNADEYNSMFEDVISGRTDPWAKKQPEISAAETEKKTVIHEPEQDKPEKKDDVSSETDFADAVQSVSKEPEDKMPDPFADDSEEILLRDLDKKSDEKIGSRLKKSIGKLFVTADGEE